MSPRRSTFVVSYPHCWFTPIFTLWDPVTYDAFATVFQISLK